MKRLLLLLTLPLIVGAFYLRSLASWRPQRVLGKGETIARLVFSDDGKRLLVVTQNQKTNLFLLTALDAEHNFAPLWRDSQPREVVVFPRFIANSAQVLIQSTHTLILDARTGKLLRDCGRLAPAVVSPNGRWLLYPHREPPIIGSTYPPTPTPLTNYRNFAVAKNLQQRLKKGTAFAFSPDSKTLVVKSGDYLEWYDVETGKPLKSPLAISNRSTKPRFTQTLWSRNGQFVLLRQTTGYRRSTVYLALWRVSDGKIWETSFPTSNAVIMPSQDALSTTSFEVQNDGTVLSHSLSGTVYLSDPATFNLKSKRLLSLPEESITATAMSPDAHYIVAGTQSGKLYHQRIK